MKKRKLGKTGIEIPEIGMGCWAIGGTAYGPVSEADALATLEAAWTGGVRFFDTADVYGDGRSEQLIAQFLKGKNRDEVVIATKGGVDFYPSSLWNGAAGKLTASGNKKNFAPEYLKFACEQSLKRLDTDRIDLYQLHNPNLDQIRAGDAVGTLEVLKKQGKIRHIGISVHTRAEALAAMEDDRVEVLQVIFNMLDQRMADEVFPLAIKKNIGILVREPLASGLLSGRYQPEHVFPKNDHRARWQSEKRRADFDKIQIIQSLIGNKPLATAALEFVLSEEAVSCVIPGAKTSAQVSANLEAGSRFLLSAEQIQKIRSLFSQDPLFQQYLLPSQ